MPSHDMFPRQGMSLGYIPHITSFSCAVDLDQWIILCLCFCQTLCGLQVDMGALFGPDAQSLLAKLNTEGQHRGYIAASVEEATATDSSKCKHAHAEHAHHGHNHEHPDGGHHDKGHCHEHHDKREPQCPLYAQQVAPCGHHHAPGETCSHNHVHNQPSARKQTTAESRCVSVKHGYTALVHQCRS
jgi:hypothetical protein